MLRLIVCILCLSGLTAAQQPPTAPQPDYVIEVRKPDGCLFAPIVGPENYGCLTHALPRAADFRPDSLGPPAPSTVRVFAKQAGELWIVKVIVGTGEFFDAGAQPVANFTLPTNQRAIVPPLDALGLGGWSVGVVRVITQAARSPQFNNKIYSIALEKIDDRPLPGPYSISLKNNSGKDVLAIQYHLLRDNKFLFLKWLGKRLPEPLIKSGEVYRLEVQSEDTTCADPDGYRPSQSNRIDLVSAIFADGSYEGEPGLAALIRGKALGNKVFLERTLTVLDNLNESGQPDASTVAFQLKYLYEAMNEQAEPYMVEALRNGLPRVSGDPAALASFIRAGQHEVKTSLMSDVRYLEAMSSAPNRALYSNKAPNPMTFQDWWALTYAKYRNWLVLVETVSSH